MLKERRNDGFSGPAARNPRPEDAPLEARRPFVDPADALAAARHEFGEHGGVNRSIETSSTFTVLEPESMPEIFSGERGPDRGGCYLYGRHFNPTVNTLGRELAALEGTETGYGTASGMSAIMAVALQLCGHGDHLVVARTIYGGSHALFHEFLPRKAGIRSTAVDVTDLDAVAAAITPRTRALYVESIANPTLEVADVPRLAELAHAHGLPLVVDNTFAPCLLSPARLGADVVVHSLTKFVSGASDMIGGAICCSEELLAQLMDVRTGALMLLGPTMDPRRAFELGSRLPHLGLRMQEHGRRALSFAERLEERGLRVHYPGLASHPQHARLQELRNPGYGFGGVLAVELEDERTANRLMAVLQNEYAFGFLAVSLGYHHTLLTCSAASTSSELGAEGLEKAGVSPGLLRISVGYTGTFETRWEQLAAALDDVGL